LVKIHNLKRHPSLLGRELQLVSLAWDMTLHKKYQQTSAPRHQLLSAAIGIQFTCLDSSVMPLKNYQEIVST
jgi:hypothetical protein